MPDKNHYARCLFSMPDASKLCQIWHTLCQVETTGFRSTQVYASYMIPIYNRNQCMTRKLMSIEVAPNCLWLKLLIPT